MANGYLYGYWQFFFFHQNITGGQHNVAGLILPGHFVSQPYSSPAGFSCLVQCEAPKIAKLVYNSNVTMVYGTQITIITGAYKPTNITWGPHIVTGFRTCKVTWLPQLLMIYIADSPWPCYYQRLPSGYVKIAIENDLRYHKKNLQLGILPWYPKSLRLYPLVI